MYNVKIKVRPQQTVRFPALCVHCSQPAAEQMEIRQRVGRTTRLVDVPLCSRCAAELAASSYREKQLQTLRWVITAVFALLSFSAMLLLTPLTMPFLLRLLTAVFVATLLSTLIWTLFQQAQRRAATPTKQAILTAARIDHFSWRTTTFQFTNEAFAERFRLINQSLLME